MYILVFLHLNLSLQDDVPMLLSCSTSPLQPDDTSIRALTIGTWLPALEGSRLFSLSQSHSSCDMPPQSSCRLVQPRFRHFRVTSAPRIRHRCGQTSRAATHSCFCGYPTLRSRGIEAAASQMLRDERIWVGMASWSSRRKLTWRGRCLRRDGYNPSRRRTWVPRAGKLSLGLVTCHRR